MSGLIFTVYTVYTIFGAHHMGNEIMVTSIIAWPLVAGVCAKLAVNREEAK